MSKLKILHKNNQISVKSKLDRKEEVSERELQVFSNKVIRGLMRPSADGKRKLTYTAPEGITLKQYLQRGISKEEFFIALAQVVEVTKKILQYRLNINNLVLNLQYTFINERTLEIYFIYQPISSQNVSTSIFAFMHDMIFDAVFYLSEDTRFVNNFTEFIRNMSVYSADEMERYIVNEFPEVYRQIQREKKEQGYETNGNQKRNGGYDRGYEPEGTTVLYEEETSLLEEEGTSLLGEETDVLGEEGTTLLNEGTTLLQEENNTVLLKSTQSSYPYLIRISNRDRVEVNKPVFRIGKERSYVDYFVANNNAVSRLHADIIKQGESYFLRDNNSTNHTFVNGVMLDVHQDQELYDGDTLMLANEGFEFHMG